MKKELSVIELFGYLVLGICISIPISFYAAWCIFKIIQWFNLPVNLTILQIYAVNQIIALYDNSEAKSKEFSDFISKVFGKAFLLSFVLLIMYIIHLIA
jgi:hypothetical protein